MRKFLAVAALVAALAVPTVAIAATLHEPHVGSSCPAGQLGVWHFVNNQTGGASAGTLVATFSSGTVTTGPSKVNQNVQHFIVEASGTLLGANTGNLPGKLVLSDFTCEDVKK